MPGTETKPHGLRERVIREGSGLRTAHARGQSFKGELKDEEGGAVLRI